MLEFALVGIPLIFVLISTFEMARGMWIYHTLAYAVREGTRFTAFHGYDCTGAAGNSCSKTIADIAGQVRRSGVGLLPDQLSLTFTANAGTANAPAVSCVLRDCLLNTTVWPPNGANYPGMDVQTSAVYPFSSAIAMFWPGAGSGVEFPTVNFPAASQEEIQF